MPEISRFLGIVIGMFFNEHGPAHSTRPMAIRRLTPIPRRDRRRERPGSQLYGTVFEPLRDPSVFRQFVVHPEFQTLVWPNGADFAPEFLHDNVRVTA